MSCPRMCFRAAKNSEVWSFFYSVFVRLLQFLAFHFGLVHYGSDPFNNASTIGGVLGIICGIKFDAAGIGKYTH